MNRFERRMKTAGERLLGHFKTADVVFKTTDSRSLPIRAIRRPPNPIETGGETGRNVFFAFEWLVTGETLDAMRSFAGYANALFSGETLVHATGVYRLDRLTPYTEADATGSVFRLLTTKEGTVDAT